MKNLNPAKEESFNHLVKWLDDNHLLLWFSNNFKEAESFDKLGFSIMHNGQLRFLVESPQNMTFLEGSKFKLVAERQEKHYTYFFTFEEPNVQSQVSF